MRPSTTATRPRPRSPGDWNGDGFDTPGLFRGSTANWWLSNSLTGSTDAGFVYGSPGMAPVVGDWSGDGKDGIGVFRSSSCRENGEGCALAHPSRSST